MKDQTKRILVVEDDVWLAQQYVRLLESCNYQVDIAPDALSALDYLNESLPDVIILDLLLTGSTAFAFLNEIRSYSDTGKIPVILSTSVASDISLEDMSRYGVSRIIDKTTMQLDDLSNAVKEVLS